MPPTPARRLNVKVLRKETDGRFCLLHLECPDEARRAVPGQFVQLRAPEGRAPQQNLLRRPFSIHLWIDANGDPAPSPERIAGLAVYFKIIGPGTQALAALEQGDGVDFLGPLGVGRDLSEPAPDRVWCVGGGYGVAPMLFWGQSLADAATEKHLVYGINQLSDLPAFPSFSDGYFHYMAKALGMQFHLSAVHLVRDLFVGTCVALLEKLLEAAPGGVGRDEVVACGPMGMMKATALVAWQRHLPCRVMLEEMMACGTGVCRSCVCPGRGEDGSARNITTCTEGPLLDAARVAWDEIG